MNTMDYSVHDTISMSTANFSNHATESTASVSLYDREGNRKYLTKSERSAFLSCVEGLTSQEDKLFCMVLVYTGARLSEILQLKRSQVDLELEAVVIRSLKKRRTDAFRAVPLPRILLAELLDLADARGGRSARIWPWGRTTGWKRVKAVMKAAGIDGPQACPKGLRHGFAIAALEAGVPITLVSRWLGHAQLSTTAIYTDVIGAEERSFAKRMWLKSHKT